MTSKNEVTYPFALSVTDKIHVGHILVRQSDDNTQVFDVKLVDKGKVRSFDGLTPFFCLFPRGTTGQGLTEEIVQEFDGKKGTFKYTLSPNAWQFVGRNEAYFSFRKQLENGTWDEQYSTKMFTYQVEKSIYQIKFRDSNYWFTFKELKEQFGKWIDSSKNYWNNFLESVKNTIESIDGGGNVLEISEFKFSKLLNKWFPTMKDRGDYWDEKIKKLDEDIDLLDRYRARIFAVDGDDITAQLVNYINNPNVYHILFPQGLTLKYSNTEKLVLDRAITIDFNDCNIEIDTEVDRVFEIGFIGEDDYRSRVNLLNYQFSTKESSKIPGTIVYFEFGVNTTLDGNFNNCTTSHSLIWQKAGYGTKIRGELRHNTSPRAIYYSHGTGEDEFSFDIDCKVDISNHNGIGIETEGGAGLISGVIEGCTDGGYFYNGKNIAMGIQLSCHFEKNTKFHVQIGTDEDSRNSSKNTGQHNLFNCLFLSGWENDIVYGSRQTIVIDGCMSMDRRHSNKPLRPLSSATDGTNINLSASYSVTYDNPINQNVISDTDFSKTTRMKNIYLYEESSKISALKNIGIRPENSTNDTISITKTSVLPQHNVTTLGGKSNAFKNITTSALHLMSGNGSIYAITISNEGKMYTTKVDVDKE